MLLKWAACSRRLTANWCSILELMDIMLCMPKILFRVLRLLVKVTTVSLRFRKRLILLAQTIAKFPYLIVRSLCTVALAVSLVQGFVTLNNKHVDIVQSGGKFIV